jgi:hypothetical protein
MPRPAPALNAAIALLLTWTSCCLQARAATAPSVDFVSPHATYATYLYPSSVATGHLNATSTVADIAACNTGLPDFVTVLFNNGSGIFTTQAQLGLPGSPSSIAIVDLNGDGIGDIVVATATTSPPGTVSVFIGNGDGTFQPRVDYALADSPVPMRVIAVTADGHPDVVVGCNGSIQFLKGSAAGTLSAAIPVSTDGRRCSSLAVGDLTGDNLPDIAAVLDGTPCTLTGNGDGTFQQPVPCTTATVDALSIGISDFNGDGSNDVAFTDVINNQVHVMLNLGGGVFGSYSSIDVGAYPKSLDPIDLNGDGLLDLVFVNVDDATIGFLQGNGDGTFQPMAAYTTGSSPYVAAAGIFTSDGKLDLVTANSGGTTVTVLLQGTGAAPAAITDLSSTGTTGTTVSMSWTTPLVETLGPAAGYQLGYSAAPITAGNFTAATLVSPEPVLASAGSTATFVVGGLSPSTTYYFALVSVDDFSRVSALSNVVTAATTVDTTLPSTVTDLAATGVAGGVALTWTAPGNDGTLGIAASYQIRYSTSAIVDAGTFAAATLVAGVPPPLTSGSAESFTVGGLIPGTTYWFALEASDASGNVSALSNVVSAVPDDNIWMPLGSGVGFDNAWNWGAVAIGADVYIAGEFTSVDGIAVNYIAEWNGTSWQAMGNGINGYGENLIADAGLIYEVGKFTTAGTVAAQNVAVWDGSAWAALGAGVPDYPYASCFYNGDLYVGGGGSGAYVCKWDGTSWTTVVTASGGWVYALASYGGKLIIGGDFSGLGGVSANAELCTWDGTTLALLGGGLDGSVSALVVDGANLYVSGGMQHAGGVPCSYIARWDGANWHALGAGLSPGGCGSMIPAQGGLFALGGFSTAGSVTANNAAFWDGAEWSAMGSGTNAMINRGALSSQGIVVTGDFTTAGTASVGGVAIYTNLRIASPGILTAPVDTATSGTLQATDLMGSVLTYSIVVQPAKGIVTLDDPSTGAYTYTGNYGYAGPDSFSFMASNAGGASNVASVAVTVVEVTSPAVTIVSPASPDMVASGSTILVSGTASDAVGIASLSYTLTGATFASGTLTAGASWSFTTPTLNIGTTTVSVTAVNAANLSSSAILTITVAGTLPPAPSITSSASAAASVGNPFTFAITATNTPVSFTASPLPSGLAVNAATGLITGSPTSAGATSVALSATNGGGTGTAILNLTVFANNQSIAFTPIGNQVYPTAPISLTASATSGLAPTFSVVSGPATLSGSTLTLTGVGVVVVAADQAGNGSYAPAPEVTQSINVSAIPIAADDAWHPLGSGVGFNNTANWGAYGNGPDVYLSGSFTQVDGVAANAIVHWNGVQWSPLGSGLNGGGDDITMLGGTLFEIGKFTTAGGTPAVNVASWNGSAWSALGSGLPDYPYAATIYNGQLCVGGGVSNGSGGFTPFVAIWNGTTWTTIATGGGGWVYALASYQGLLAIGGDYGGLGGVSGNGNLCFWNGTSLSVVGGGLDGSVGSLAVSGSSLYASGGFQHAGGIPCSYIGRWDGSTWNALGAGLSPGGCGAMIPAQGGLYACGGFSTAGTVSASNVAFWNGSAWSALGSGVNGQVYTAALCNGGLVVTGPFSSAGGKPVGGVAIYNNQRIAYAGTLTAPVNTAASGTLVCIDSLGNPLTAAILTQPLHGTVTLTDAVTGAYTYLGNPGFAGTDSFSFMGSDSGGNSNAANVVVTDVDVTAPSVAITSPVSPDSVNSANPISITGTASDNVGVVKITYALTGATIASGTLITGTSWSFSTPTLHAGTTTVTVTAYDAAGNSGSAQLTINVAIPTILVPTISWTAPSAIVFGTALSGAQLDATASVPGTFAYAPAAGEVLNAGSNQTLTVTFTPTDTVDYATAGSSQLLTVSQAPLTITANNAAREAGAANPAFTFASLGLIGTDAISQVGLSTTANASSPVGSYPITASNAVFASGSPSNYAITYQPGVLAVTDNDPPVIDSILAIGGLVD